MKSIIANAIATLLLVVIDPPTSTSVVVAFTTSTTTSSSSSSSSSSTVRRSSVGRRGQVAVVDTRLRVANEVRLEDGTNVEGMTTTTTTEEDATDGGVAEVVLVGCGAPNRGMGWYHAVQMLEGRCPSASLDYVVEGWFLGPGSSTPGGPEFNHWASDSTTKYGTKFVSSVSDLPPPQRPRVALISGRTSDNPKLLSECISAGCQTIYLEKPGAPTVLELENMMNEAKDANVVVLMGYNKNVCKYVRKTREYAETLPGSHVTFVSNNAYENTPESLGECFERNAEGMLKNMAIHELALLVSFYDVTVENIDSVIADRDFSSMQTLPGPSGKEYTDFDKIKFTIKTKTGKVVSVAADRCGGTDSYATVSDADGVEVFRYSMPDDEDRESVKALQAKYPTAMPYFFTQDPDYVTVKERVARFTATGEEAVGVATIDVAVETLRVAEFLTPTLMEQLK